MRGSRLLLSPGRWVQRWKRRVKLFKGFSVAASAAIVKAPEEARRLSHNYVGTEHLLLAVVDDDYSVAAGALRSLGIGAGDVRSAVKSTIGFGLHPHCEHLSFTTATEKALKQSWREASDLGADYVGTEHILLSLITAPDNEGVKLLVSLYGSDREELRRNVLDYIAGRHRRERAR